MPQASDELRERIEVRFGDPIDEGPVIRWLVKRGFTLKRGFSWKSPKPRDQITPDEWEALQFLVDEWDFAGVDEYA